jgi:hypothetical protein
MFLSSDEFWKHALHSHQNVLRQDESERQRNWAKYESDFDTKEP